MKRKPTAIDQYVKPLKDCPTQAFLSNTVLVADVMDWVLWQIGKSRIWQTTYSISEEFLRRIFFIGKRYGIEENTLILDHKATNKTLKLWVFIDRVFQNVHLADNHSKLLLFHALGDGRKISVITSQNLTRGDRMESTLITSDPIIFDTLLESINNVIEFHSVPLDEILRGRIEAD